MKKRLVRLPLRSHSELQRDTVLPRRLRMDFPHQTWFFKFEGLLTLWVSFKDVTVSLNLFFLERRKNTLHFALSRNKWVFPLLSVFVSVASNKYFIKLCLSNILFIILNPTWSIYSVKWRENTPNVTSCMSGLLCF